MDRTRFQQQQMTSGLTRYRSAPTSYFSTLMNSSAAADAGSITGGGGGGGGGYPRGDFDRQAFGRLMASLDSQDLSSNQQNPKRNLNVKQESEAFEQPFKQKLQKVDLLSKGDIGNYSGQARNTHTSGATTASTSAMDRQDSSFGLMNSSNLTRYNTSPAGFFDQMDIQNEYGGEAVFSSSSLRFKNHTSFSSGQPTSCSAPMDPISEIGDESVKDEGSPRNHEDYASAFSLPPWEDSDIFSDYFLNAPGEKPLLNPNTSDVQGEDQSRTPGLLSHHLSLPKSSAQLSAIMQDSVPCKVRAKRGCATHPRSIAERVRRTRISERMRKLQELVPNMDKQTNTADMLDLAVDYIKGLESKVKVLSENRAKCKCSGK
ncbi:unnamed protein product [Cuscuta europaea]|uniref:BHLH domain-containing protein n=1 Tax=Cuscuta europaea TaxID=41803 RepID=A0A9P0YQW3_CUSEU|nr:unnamed protein product [Cuscuta europaea]